MLFLFRIDRRAIQHGEDETSKVDEESLALIQDMLVTRLNGLVGTIKAEDKRWTVSSQTQACLVFATCQTVPNLPACKLEALDRPLLTSLLVDYMLQPNEGVIPVNEIIRVINYELAREKNRLVVNGPSHALLSKTVRGPLFSEMGRVARTVATLIESMGNKDDRYKGYWGEIEDILQKLHSFAVNLHVDWSRCALSQADSFTERAEGDRTGGLDAETIKSTGMLFQVFKTLLFAYTMIFGAIVEKSTSDPGKESDRERKEYNFVHLYCLPVDTKILVCSSSLWNSSCGSCFASGLLDSGQLRLLVFCHLQARSRRIPGV